jgi:hypothetical protein
MKLEIEITEEEIKSAIERKVRTAIADQSNQWHVDSYIKSQVGVKWKETVDSMITELLQDSPVLREKIIKSIEAKLRSQVIALMKEVKK